MKKGTSTRVRPQVSNYAMCQTLYKHPHVSPIRTSSRTIEVSYVI